MLCLSRKAGESIVINDDIKVTIIQIQNGKVRLGVTAPESVPIDREEIHQKKLEQMDAPAPKGIWE